MTLIISSRGRATTAHAPDLPRRSQCVWGNRGPAPRFLRLAPCLLALSLAALTTSAARAATYPISTVAQLDSAVTNAQSGDTIQVAAGTYALDRTLSPNNGVTLAGAGASQTILDGGNSRQILSISGSVVVSSLTIQHGSSNGGGGIYSGGTLTLIACALTSNTSSSGGGGLYNFEGTVTLIDCTVSGNSGQSGGGLYNYGTMTLTGCTVTGNNSSFRGGSLYSFHGNVTLTDDIVYGDTTSFQAAEIYVNDGSLSATYSDIQGGLSGTGNINANPLFVTPYTNASTSFDLHLQTGSPVIGMGTTSAPNDSYLPYDIAGTTRANPPTIGAYEFTVRSSTNTSLNSNANPSVYGQSVTFTATVSNTSNSAIPTDGVVFTVDGVAGSPVTLNGSGSATYTTSSLSVGSHTVVASYAGNAGFSGSTSGSLTQSVIGAPTSNPQSVSAPFNTATSITLTGSDPNNPPRSLTYTIGTGPSHGTFSGTAPNLTYTPSTGYHGADSFTFTVSNGVSTSSAATVNITVAAGIPTANSQSASASFNTAKPITLTGSDPDSPALPLTYTLGTGPAHGTLSGTAPNLTYTPSAGYQGTDSFTFSVSNGTNTSTAATVNITVGAGTPTANSQSVSTNENTAKAITLTGSDPDSPALSLTYTVASGPSHGTLSGTAPNLTYTPTSGYYGNDSFTFTVSNGTNTSAPATVSITVNQVSATVTAASVAWGTAGTAALQTAADGLRLLPTGRTTDLPWTGIKSLTITLSVPAALSSGDVTVTGTKGGSYGPVTVSGSGTSYTITLAKPISAADRVTLTLSNANISAFTRRLDVLPGDVGDDGSVSSSDLVLDKNAFGTTNAYADINGDNAVNITDYNFVRQYLGTILP